MSHRDNDILTGHITNETHGENRPRRTERTAAELRAAFERAFAQNPGGAYPTRLPIELYERAKREDFEMTGYAYELPDSQQRIYLPPTLYDAANAQGYDLTGFVRQEPIPTTIPHPMPSSAEMRAATQERIDAGLPLGASHNAEPLLGMTHVGSLAAPVYATKPRGPDCACCEQQPRKDCSVPGCSWASALPYN